MMRINVGCGQTPTPGWRNFDNSFSVRLAKSPFLQMILRTFRLLNDRQRAFIAFLRSNRVEYGDVTKRLPLPDASVEVMYSSHMMEHLDRSDAGAFLKEAARVLKPGGVLRLALPDLERQAHEYLKNGDADEFVERTHLAVPQPRSFAQRARALLFGSRHHQWMYDGRSLCRLLSSNGFVNVLVIPAGETRIPNSAGLNLRERESESIYVEAEVPK